MSTFNKSLLSVAVEGFEDSAPSMEEYVESLNYSAEGWKGAMKGFLLSAGGQFSGGVAGAAVGGPLGLLLGRSAGAAAVTAAQTDRMLKLRREILVVSKRIADLKKGHLEKVEKAGYKVPKTVRSGADIATTVTNAVGGAYLTAVNPFYALVETALGASYGSQIENLEKDLDSKIQQLKREFQKAGLEVEDDDNE